MEEENKHPYRRPPDNCPQMTGQGAIQVLRNADGSGRVSHFPEKNAPKVYGSKLLALRGGGWGSK